VRFVAPPGSSLTFGVSGGMPTGGGVLPGGLTCFWAIPLITIVAYFLLNLFLPIVVLVFGLWWMLLLKFCSLPAFSLNADIAANLTAGIDLDVGLSASAVATARAELKADLDAHLGSPSSGPSPSARADSDNLANQPIAEFQSRLANPPGAPDFTAGLEWEAEVEREPVEVAP
jgi:hypothetical protein